MRVHFASGEHPFSAPWINIDFIDQKGVDIVADLIEDIPKEIQNIELAYVGHFLEHLTPTEVIYFLQRVGRRMAPYGKLVIVGPDVGKARDLFNAGGIPEELFLATQAHGSIPDGEPNNRADIHMWDCTGSDVLSLCRQAGWAAVAEIPLGQLKTTVPEVPIIDAAEWQFCVIAENK